MAKRKKELKFEDVKTYAQQLEYSRQVWEREQNMGFWDARIFDFVVEREEWESPHWWINQALLQREKRKLARELGLLDKQK